MSLGQGQGEFFHPPGPSAALSGGQQSHGQKLRSSHLSYTLQEILAWNKNAAGAKIHVPGSLFPSAARGHPGPQKNGWHCNRALLQSREGLSQSTVVFRQERSLEVLLNSTCLQPPASPSILHLGLSWRGEQSAHGTRNAWEPDTLHQR